MGDGVLDSRDEPAEVHSVLTYATYFVLPRLMQSGPAVPAARQLTWTPKTRTSAHTTLMGDMLAINKIICNRSAAARVRTFRDDIAEARDIATSRESDRRRRSETMYHHRHWCQSLYAVG